MHVAKVNLSMVGKGKVASSVNKTLVIYNKENLERQETNKYGKGQSGTYLRLTRALSGPRVSVAKTYRDETN